MLFEEAIALRVKLWISDDWDALRRGPGNSDAILMQLAFSAKVGEIFDLSLSAEQNTYHKDDWFLVPGVNE